MSSILEHSAQFNKMTDLIVRDRLKEICPDECIEDLSFSEIIEDCNVAFKIIGYNPRNLHDSVKEIYVNEDITSLWMFVYRVWEVDQ